MYNVDVTFHMTGKPINSTLRPIFEGDYDATEMLCELYEPFDILAPVIIVDDEHRVDLPGHTHHAISDYNYCYISSDIGRYYWITNWERRDGLWYAHCAEDYLASFKDDILNTTQYVLRTGRSDLWDNYISDSNYGYSEIPYNAVVPVPINSIANWYNYSDHSIFPKTSANYEQDYNRSMLVYMVCNSTLNLNSLEVDDYDADKYKKIATQTWVFPAGALPYIMANIKRNYTIDQENVNPSDFIQRMYMLPVEPFEIDYMVNSSETISFNRKYLIFGSRLDAETDIKAGDSQLPNLNKTYCMMDMRDTDTSLTEYLPEEYYRRCRPLKTNAVRTFDFLVDISQYKSAIAFQNGGNYAAYNVRFEPFGQFSLDSNLFVTATKLKLRVYIDYNTGNAELKYAAINDPSVEIWNSLCTTNIALDIQWQNVVNNANAWSRQHVNSAFDVVNSAINNLMAPISGAQGTGIAAGISAAAAGLRTLPAVGQAIYNFVDKAPVKNVSNIGGTIGCAIMDSEPILYIRRITVNDRYDYRFGRPLCAPYKLSEVAGGICVCQNAVFGGTGIGNRALSAERQAIENALNGGVYLE